jgi:hypothetical protein
LNAWGLLPAACRLLPAVFCSEQCIVAAAAAPPLTPQQSRQVLPKRTVICKQQIEPVASKNSRGKENV